MFGDVYFLCALMLAIPLKARRYAKIMVFFVLWIIGFADMMCYQTMGVALCPNILQTWMQTNLSEASEVLGVHLNASIFLTPVSLIVFLPLVFYFIRKEKVRLPRAAMCVLLLLTFSSAVYGIENKRYLCNLLTRTSEEDTEYLFEEQTMTRDYLPAYRLITSVSEIRRFSNMRQHLVATLENTSIEGCSHDSPLIVIIVGESYNRHHASLYGYDKPTTPLQEKFFAEGNMYKFTDVISSYNLTYKSFQNMLTFYDYDSKGMWYDFPNVLSMFRKGGYEVGFFSNQNTIRKASAFTDYCEDVFINDSQLSRYMFDKRNAETHDYDLQLLSDYRQLCSSTEKPRLLIFHFIGMHAAYKQRYPDNETVFSPEDYNRPDLDDDQRQTLADYDNAIVYNDKVIAAIIDEFKDDNAIIIHVPDHGELVYDECNELGRKLRLDPRHIKPQFDIPFWIYCTEKYKATHEEKVRQIEKSVNNPFMTDDLPHLLVDIAGIKCKEYNPQRNLIDPSFNPQRKRKICGEMEYR